MLRSLTAAFLTLTLALPFAATESAEPSARPNILILVADDLGAADLGVLGAKELTTPAIDSLAHQGVLCTAHYVSAPVCSPTRAGLISGRYQTRFGHELNHPQADQGPVGLPVEVKTWPEYFAAAGFATGHVGKWHLGNPTMPQFTPQARGFEETWMFRGARKLPRPRIPLIHNGLAEESAETYVDLAIADKAALFIHQHDAQPWCLYTAFLTPHEPVELPNGVAERFASIADEKRRRFAGAMSLLDEAVARILKALVDTGQVERTLVLFFSDNGAPPGNGSSNAPYRGTKGTLWEGGIRAPLLARWPGKIPAGRVLDTPLIALDLLPTALEAAGVITPDAESLDGRSVLKQLTGASDEPAHEALFWRYGDQWAVRAGDWKLVHAAAPRTVATTQLFHLADDPQETNDRSASEPEVRARLESAWRRWNSANVPALWGTEPRGR